MHNYEKRPEDRRKQRFKELIEPYYQALKAFGMKLARDENLRDDLFQETVLKAWKHLDKVDPDRNVKSWLFKIMHNNYRDMMRKRNRRNDSIEFIEEVAHNSGEGYAGAVQDHDLEEETFKQLRADQIKHALDKLPEKYRVCVVLCDLQDLAYKEIAQVLDIPMGTVMSRLYRGRNMLRDRLSGAGNKSSDSTQREAKSSG